MKIVEGEGKFKTEWVWNYYDKILEENAYIRKNEALLPKLDVWYDLIYDIMNETKEWRKKWNL